LDNGWTICEFGSCIYRISDSQNEFTYSE